LLLLLTSESTFMIIGVCGFIGSGKDTVADYLVNVHHFRRESFAATLKDAVSAIFGWDREMLEGRTRSSREWREQPDVWWSQRLGREITPRWILQHWGTEVCRTHFHDDIWIASLENKLRTNQDDVVISDCRFPNEIAAIRRAGGKIVRVIRGPEPSWYDHAVKYNAGPSKIGWALGRHALEKANVHASEYAWVGTAFDAVLDNNSSVDALYQQITSLVQDPRAATAAGF
jgi:hypothetical protein